MAMFAPVLKNQDIVKCISSLGILIVEGDLTKPSKLRAVEVWGAIVAHFQGSDISTAAFSADDDPDHADLLAGTLKLTLLTDEV